MIAVKKAVRDWSFVALLGAQALSSFNHSMLRSAVLTLVSFRGLTAYGLSPEALVAACTLLIVLPYVMLSLPAGRLADRFARTRVIKTMMGFDVALLGVGAIGLATGTLGLLLTAILLAGIQAALLGPAKFAVLPDVLDMDRLVAGNGWISATSTVAVLLGLILGNLLALSDAGTWLVALGSVTLAVLGAGLAGSMRPTAPMAPELSLHPLAMLDDFGGAAQMLTSMPILAWPLIGSCWFWFQGTLATALIPLHVAATAQPAGSVSVMMLAATSGVALGAMLASSLVNRVSPGVLSLLVMPILALPALDFTQAAQDGSSASIVRAAVDLLILSAGSGFYFVPLTAAIQRLTPAAERARFVGISHTLTGFAMCLAGAAIYAYPLLGLRTADSFMLLGMVTAPLAAMALWRVLAGHQTVNARR